MITIDISSKISEASKHSSAWDTGAVKEMLSLLASQRSEFRVDWEVGDENWGRVTDGQSDVAFVCARIPLIVVLKSLEVAANELGNEYVSEVLIVESFDVHSFSVDAAILEDVFKKSLSPNVNYSALSIHDLWWATV